MTGGKDDSQNLMPLNVKFKDGTPLENLKNNLSSDAASIWDGVKRLTTTKDGLKSLAHVAMKAATFPFSMMGETNWGNTGGLDLLEGPAGAAEAISPWLALQKKAIQQKKLWDQVKREEQMIWQVKAEPGSRERLAEMLLQLPDELKKRKLSKLMSRTRRVRRNPETGEPEFLLHRGVGRPESEIIKSANELPHVASFTPWERVASNFAYPDVVSSWVPESKIAGIPKELGSYVNGNRVNSFADEYEVITLPGIKPDRIANELRVPRIRQDLEGIQSEKLYNKLLGKTKKEEAIRRLEGIFSNHDATDPIVSNWIDNIFWQYNITGPEKEKIIDDLYRKSPFYQPPVTKKP